MWLYTIWPLCYPAVKTEELSNSASRWWVSQKNLTCKWPINTFPLLIAFLKFDATASSIAAWRFAASRILSDDQWFLYLLSRWQCFSSLCGPSLLGVTLFFKSPKRLEEDHTLRWCGLKLLFGEMWYDFLRKSRLRLKWIRFYPWRSTSPTPNRLEVSSLKVNTGRFVLWPAH